MNSRVVIWCLVLEATESVARSMQSSHHSAHISSGPTVLFLMYLTNPKKLADPKVIQQESAKALKALLRSWSGECTLAQMLKKQPKQLIILLANLASNNKATQIKVISPPPPSSSLFWNSRVWPHQQLTDEKKILNYRISWIVWYNQRFLLNSGIPMQNDTSGLFWPSVYQEWLICDHKIYWI